MRDALASLDLTEDAEAFLLTLWGLIQSLDDWVDGEPVERAAKNTAIWQAIVALPSDPFLAAHRSVLVPVMANAVLKWQASDFVEREKVVEQYPKAYMWRAGYYDVALQVVMICHGVERATAMAPVVIGLYGESLDDYMREFNA